MAAKLRVTAAALGVSGQKELCAAFRRVNPRTGFDLDRSYKWMQGRSLPRSQQVYEDWSAVCELDRPGAWIAASTLDEFATALGARHGLDPEVLLRRAGVDERSASGTRKAVPGQEEHYLQGVYACFSHAQSPYYRDRIICGALLVESVAPRSKPGNPSGTGLAARYSQALPSGQAYVSGPILRGAGRALTLTLHEGGSAGTAPLCLSLALPAPPGSLLAGIMTGFTMLDPAAQPPYATRIVMIRVPVSIETVESAGGYLSAEPASLGRELRGLGLVLSPAAELEARLWRFLTASEGGRAGTDQAPMADHAALNAACDRAWFDTLEASEAPPFAQPLAATGTKRR
ncbi:hypothetical protein [Sabulicella rubraurantiaca]|uniref:hypothetical protein n=1 Tax=Sabulicella rubraurantiaca TaxID=2811429 RepID=UPI001A96A785|nr:hypothetical protein [Sabulicella rubraurantiaca]